LKVSVKHNATDIDNSGFYPIDSLARSDADLSLILLSGNGVTYSGSQDDWYEVSSSFVDIPTGNFNGMAGRPVYFPSEPASPLGCAIQHQFCNSKLGDIGCGPLSSLRDAVAGVASFFDTDYAEIAGHWVNETVSTDEVADINYYFIWMSFGFPKSIYVIFLKLGLIALLLQRTLVSSIQGLLTPNQWQQDISYAWNISLDLIQGSTFDTAYGPSDRDYLQSWVKFTSPSLKKFCNIQVCTYCFYKDSGHFIWLFSLFGLYFTFITG
jgi:hypothetical protein